MNMNVMNKLVESKPTGQVLVFLNANRNNPQAYGITVVALHPEVFRVSYFPQGTGVLF